MKDTIILRVNTSIECMTRDEGTVKSGESNAMDEDAGVDSLVRYRNTQVAECPALNQPVKVST